MEGGGTTAKPSIVLVAADPAVAQPLVRSLARTDHRVWHAPNPTDALRLVALHHPQAVVLDVAPPEAETLIACAALRAATGVPLLLCSSPPHQWARVGLCLGADDFLRKPVRLDELEARLARLLTHAPPTANAPRGKRAVVLHVADLEIAPAQHRASLNGWPLPLTPTEYRLLLALATRAGAVLRRADLVQLMWRSPSHAHGRLLDSHIRRLRRKLVTGSVHITTERGTGYRLSSNQPES